MNETIQNENFEKYIYYLKKYLIHDDEISLENYKNSALFKSIWPNIKVWFDAKPEAWSLETTFDGFK